MKQYVLNLDTKFNPFPPGNFNTPYELQFDSFTFGGGEPHIQIDKPEYIDPFDLVTITHRYNMPGDLIQIILANDALKRLGFNNIELVLPYFPGARQDRVCNEGEALSVKVFSDMINSCKFNRVFIYSPHSDVTPALIDNVVELDLDKVFLKEIINELERPRGVNIVCPDAGAGKRVGKLTKEMADAFPGINFNLIRCEKIRDVATGELKEFFVMNDDLRGFPTIIVDDIVANGGTFLGLGKVLNERNCGKLILFTSHADHTEGLGKMGEFFDQVYTSNSKSNGVPYANNVTKIKITL